MSMMTASYYPSVNTFMWPSNDGWYHDYPPRPVSHQQLRSVDERKSKSGSRTPGLGRHYEETVEEQELRMRLIMMVNDLTEDIDEDMVFSSSRQQEAPSEVGFSSFLATIFVSFPQIYSAPVKAVSEAMAMPKNSRPKRVRTKRPQRMKALAAANRTESRQHSIPPTRHS